MTVKIKKYLKWFPICGIAITSLQEEIKYKSGVFYMIYQALCCSSWFFILGYLTRNY
jgi:hypothetical protein